MATWKKWLHGKSAGSGGAALAAQGWFEIRYYGDIVMTTSFFLGRWSAVNSGMHSWRDRLFIVLSRQAANATDFFAIPSDRVVEIGAQVTV
jgi:K+ transporter